MTYVVRCGTICYFPCLVLMNGPCSFLVLWGHPLVIHTFGISLFSSMSLLQGPKSQGKVTCQHIFKKYFYWCLSVCGCRQPGGGCWISWTCSYRLLCVLADMGALVASEPSLQPHMSVFYLQTQPSRFSQPQPGCGNTVLSWFHSPAALR